MTWLSALGALALLGGSICFTLLVAGGHSQYPRWFAVSSPFVLVLGFAAVGWLAPAPVGGYLWPLCFNLAMLVFFALSVYLTSSARPQGRWATHEPPGGIGDIQGCRQRRRASGTFRVAANGNPECPRFLPDSSTDSSPIPRGGFGAMARICTRNRRAGFIACRLLCAYGNRERPSANQRLKGHRRRRLGFPSFNGSLAAPAP
jgi:hypothetical protein